MKGFTLVELLMVVGVIGLLMVASIFSVIRGYTMARNKAREEVMSSLKAVLEIYYLHNQTYPNLPNNFCGMYMLLKSGNYLVESLNDPTTHTDVCTNAGEGNKFLGGAMYHYEATPSSGISSSYLLKLGREGGGASNFYKPD
jgi:prepilin-type N-terminal cleavage/methylation domain-containing protein